MQVSYSQYDNAKSGEPSTTHVYPYRFHKIDSALGIDDDESLLSYRLSARDTWIEPFFGYINTQKLSTEISGDFKRIDMEEWIDHQNDMREQKDEEIAKRRTPIKVPNKLTVQEQVSKNILDVNFKTVSDLNFQEQEDVLAVGRIAGAMDRVRLTELDKIQLDRNVSCNYSFKIPRVDLARMLLRKPDGVIEVNDNIYDGTLMDNNVEKARKSARAYKETKNMFNTTSFQYEVAG